MKNSADFELYDKIKKYRRSILKTSVLVLFVACLLVYACACYYSGVNAFQKEAQLCSAINAEADQNVAAFMKKMEDTAKLIMGNEDYANMILLIRQRVNLLCLMRRMFSLRGL